MSEYKEKIKQRMAELEEEFEEEYHLAYRGTMFWMLTEKLVQLEAKLAIIEALHITPEASALTLGETIMELQEHNHQLKVEVERLEPLAAAYEDSKEEIAEIMGAMRFYVGPIGELGPDREQAVILAWINQINEVLESRGK